MFPCDFCSFKTACVACAAAPSPSSLHFAAMVAKHLGKLSAFWEGPRLKAELSKAELEEIIKATLKNPYPSIDTWMMLCDEAFISKFQNLFEALANGTFRLNEKHLFAAMQSIYKTDKHEADAFCGKAAKAFHFAWLKSKKVVTGDRTSPSLRALFQVWARRHASPSKSEPTPSKQEPNASSVKTERPSSSSASVAWRAQDIKREPPESLQDLPRTVKVEFPSPEVKRSLESVPSSPLVPKKWSSPKTKWKTDATEAVVEHPLGS